MTLQERGPRDVLERTVSSRRETLESTSARPERRPAMQDQNSTVIDLAEERAKREARREEAGRQMTFDIDVDEEGAR